MDDQTNPSTPDPFPRDDLPPVEVPTAGFLIQLFVIPAVIVAAVVLVYVLFGQIAANESDPAQYVAGLRDSNPVRRWQAAHGLAQTLEADKELRDNEKLALELVGLLQEELDAGATVDEPNLLLRAYLATALGRFNHGAGVPVLRRAINPPQAVEVRIRALDALENLGARVGDLVDADLAGDLIRVSEDPEAIVRKVSAHAMGALGDARFVPRLEGMLVDGDLNVRYNAALALASNGQEAAVPVLAEMLNPENQDALRSEELKHRDYKASVILLSAVEATGRLLAHNDRADLSPLRAPLVQLRQHTLASVRLKATDVLLKLERRERRERR